MPGVTLNAVANCEMLVLDVSPPAAGDGPALVGFNISVDGDVERRLDAVTMMFMVPVEPIVGMPGAFFTVEIYAIDAVGTLSQTNMINVQRALIVLYITDCVAEFTYDNCLLCGGTDSTCATGVVIGSTIPFNTIGLRAEFNDAVVIGSTITVRVEC